MGIKVRWEAESGRQLEELLDPQNYLGFALQLPIDKTICLRFIDPYGDTIFNQKQIPVLINELQFVLEQVSAESVAVWIDVLKAQSKMFDLPPKVIGTRTKNISASAISGHIRQILELANRSMGKTHTYLKFYGE